MVLGIDRLSIRGGDQVDGSAGECGGLAGGPEPLIGGGEIGVGASGSGLVRGSLAAKKPGKNAQEPWQNLHSKAFDAGLGGGPSPTWREIHYKSVPFALSLDKGSR